MICNLLGVVFKLIPAGHVRPIFFFQMFVPLVRKILKTESHRLLKSSLNILPSFGLGKNLTHFLPAIFLNDKLPDGLPTLIGHIIVQFLNLGNPVMYGHVPHCHIRLSIPLTGKVFGKTFIHPEWNHQLYSV